MKIIYVHHGNRKVNKNQKLCDDLSIIGKKDATLLSKLFKFFPNKNKIKAIYTAPSVRCSKTAQIINKSLKLPVIVDERFDELNSFKNETYKDFLIRNANAIDDIINKYDDDDTVVCVASGVNVSAFVCRSFGLKITDKIPKIGIPSCSPLIFNINKKEIKNAN